MTALLGGALGVFAALLAACGASDEETQVLKLSVETAPGVVRFDKQRLSAKYTYLCSTGGYWRTAHGTLVVR